MTMTQWEASEEHHDAGEYCVFTTSIAASIDTPRHVPRTCEEGDGKMRRQRYARKKEQQEQAEDDEFYENDKLLEVLWKCYHEQLSLNDFLGTHSSEDTCMDINAYLKQKKLHQEVEKGNIAEQKA